MVRTVLKQVLSEVENGKSAPCISLTFGWGTQLKNDRGNKDQIKQKKLIRNNGGVNFIKKIYAYKEQECQEPAEHLILGQQGWREE